MLVQSRLPEAAVLYLDTLEAAGRSPHTIIAYRRVISKFIQLCDQRVDALVDTLAVRDLLDLQPSVTTKSHALVTLRQWFKFLRNRGLIETDPSAGIPIPRARRRLYGTIDPTQFRALFATRTDNLSRVLISVLYYTGTRITETLSIRVEHVSFVEDGGYIDLPERKGGDGGYAAFGPELAGVLRPWLVGRSGWVFPGSGGPLTREAAAKRLAGAGKRAGIPGRVTPHRLRHVFATLAAESGWNQLALQKQLGHTDPTSTAVYYQASRKGLLSAYRRAFREGFGVAVQNHDP